MRLASLFGLEIGFRAVMSNHYHLVLRSRPDVVKNWTDAEVVRRCLVFQKIKRTGRFENVQVSEAEVRLALGDPKKVAKYRERLSSVSWFMGTLNEAIARRANKEDGTFGHFFEQRFGCKLLKDETSLLICGMYVDLNQIRAGEVITPEESVHCSVADRIEGERQRFEGITPEEEQADAWLAPLEIDERLGLEGNVVSRTNRRASDKGFLSISCKKYLELLDWVGRQVTQRDCKSIPSSLKPILERLSFPVEHLVDITTGFMEVTGMIVDWSASDMALE